MVARTWHLRLWLLQQCLGSCAAALREESKQASAHRVFLRIVSHELLHLLLQRVMRSTERVIQKLALLFLPCLEEAQLREQLGRLAFLWAVSRKIT